MRTRFALFRSHGYGLVRSLLWAIDLAQGSVLRDIGCFRSANGCCLGLKVLSPDQRGRESWAIIGRGCGQQQAERADETSHGPSAALLVFRS
jgi:hypothetical protein